MGPRMIAHLQKLSFGQVCVTTVLNHTSASAVRRPWAGYDPDSDCDLRAAVGLSIQSDVWCVLVVLVGYGIIGFVDDIAKWCVKTPRA